MEDMLLFSLSDIFNFSKSCNFYKNLKSFIPQFIQFNSVIFDDKFIKDILLFYYKTYLYFFLN
ncbi:unknown similar to AMEV077 [Mythimna separata entomopoxvirus 'L']|uniref:Uncharacterized protein n=1 Tax=Mythimna separata entomopoxvirus 'L' TaxID=1293572 RepID=A0A916KQF9_9POXV|nr:unknown similar to AMEV077 [Mythimna separata entomopoxvirus 'L']CCU56489.1 unknown similar to AMEV077 [Mythimna separata entomopoxvirus 'L']